MKRIIECIVLIALVIIWVKITPSKTIAITGDSPTGIWAQFSDANRHNGWEVLTCESQLQNICRPDSDGIDSCGIAQIHQDGTWPELEKQSGIKGSFMYPPTAASMLNWALDKASSGTIGPLSRWTCAKIKKIDGLYLK